MSRKEDFSEKLNRLSNTVTPKFSSLSITKIPTRYSPLPVIKPLIWRRFLLLFWEMYNRQLFCTRIRSFLMKTSTRSCKTLRKSSPSIRTLILMLPCHRSCKKCTIMSSSLPQGMELSQRQWLRQWRKICQWACNKWALLIEDSAKMAEHTTTTRTHMTIIFPQGIYHFRQLPKRLKRLLKPLTILLVMIRCKTQQLLDKELLVNKIAKKVRSEVSNQ